MRIGTMNRLSGLFVVLFVACAAIAWGEQAGPFVYPKAVKSDTAEDYHGKKIPDPYRGLENPDAPDTRTWIEAQNKITFPFLHAIPGRDRIKERLTKLWDYEKYSPSLPFKYEKYSPWLPFKKGGRYFYTKNDGLQNQSVLYTMASLDAQPKVLLDPNKLSEDGTVALSGTSITEDGKLMAYSLSAKGSDWQEWSVKDVETGKDLSDNIKWVKFSGASWTHDGKGFFYSRYDEPPPDKMFEAANYFQKLFYHRLGTPQSEDVLVYERKDQKEWGFRCSVTDDGRYLIISVWKGTEPKKMVFYKDLQTKDSPIVELIREFDADYDFIDNDGPVFWFRTDNAAPRHRVVAIDIRNPNPKDWKEILPQAAETLQGVSAVGGHFVGNYLKDAYTQVKVFGLDGKPVREVSLPGIGSASGFGGRRDDSETFYAFTSFTDPGSLYRYDVKSGQTSVFRQPKISFNPADYETKQVFYNSKDGTRVPMFVTSKKGLKLDGNNPTLLYGYGGFNIPITPSFRVSTVVWMEMGGVYASACLRGGGEYGKDWHDAGRKLKKQNVFDDFIAAAEWLIANKYTNPSKLAIQGGSNGGLLVGAAMTQRPELFGAALPAVGVLDMLRFHKYTIGWAWTSDYGSADNPEEFKALFAYSPLHNLKPGTSYPSTLITTADHDDRVVPAHSFKFAAALQEAHSGPQPVLIRIDVKAGHGAGKPTSMRIDEGTDILAFLVKTLGMNVPLITPDPPKATEKTSG